jgi:hypothetical protein
MKFEVFGDVLARAMAGLVSVCWWEDAVGISQSRTTGEYICFPSRVVSLTYKRGSIHRPTTGLKT